MIRIGTALFEACEQLEREKGISKEAIVQALCDAMVTAYRKHIKVKELKFVYDENKENSNVFMIRAVKNAKEGMIVTKPIIIKRGEKHVL